MEIRAGGLGDARVEALIRHHRDEARATTPACNAHSLDSTGLRDPAVSFFSAWDGNTLLGIGAIKQLDATHAELKSMRTAPDQLRRGVGRAMLVHALAHIEFNAVNLALDAIWRFPGMPPDYYSDWLRVAAEEAHHFTLLAAHLHTLGWAYGDFPGHDSLWEMVAKTSGDVLARMALVPRTMEARGLDAIPPLRAKLAQVGDKAGAAIIDIILAEEIGHVAIGNRWYRWLCAQRGLDPIDTYDELARRHDAPRAMRPLNIEARRAAGFDDEELARLERSA